MGTDSAIEWTDDTVNPWWGCTKVSPACTNCYAESLDARFKMGGEAHWGPGAPRLLRVDNAIAELHRIARRSDQEGRPRRVFIASMSDFFEDREDLVEPRRRVWEVLHELAGDKPRITPLLLTKRPDVMAAWAEEHGWPDNAWAGTTVEDQRRADERIPHLLRVPARVRFLSMEPLLEPVELEMLAVPMDGEPGCLNALTGMWWPALGDHEAEHEERRWWRDGANVGPCGDLGGDGDGVSCVIVGGESGPGARPTHPAWARSLRDQCQSAGVAFFFKQHGAWQPERPARPDDLLDARREVILRPDGTQTSGLMVYGADAWVMRRVGKKAAGRLLDGREWSEVPHG